MQRSCFRRYLMRSKLAIYSTLVVLWMMGSFLHAQSGYVYTQELSTYYASRSVFVCSDNSVVVLGNVDDYSDFWLEVTITKLDPQGNLLWRRYIDPAGHDYTVITGDGKDDSGRSASQGIYFVRLDNGSRHAMRKMVLMR